MRLNNLTSIEDKMINNNIDVAFFTLNYHSCILEIVYSLVQKKFIFAIKGTQLGFTCCIDTNGFLNGQIDNTPVVDELATCSGKGKRDPKHFYTHLDMHLPTVSFHQAKKIQYINILGVAVKDNENNIYFKTWKHIRISRKNGQYEKTVHLLGAEIAEYCWTNSITPVYWNTPSDRTFDIAVNYQKDYDTNR